MRGLSRLQTILIIATVAVLLGSVLFIFLGYLPKASASSDIESDITAAEMEIARLEWVRGEIDKNEDKLADIMEELAEVPIPNGVDSREVLNSVIEAVKDAKVLLESLEHEDKPSGSSIGEHAYQTDEYHISCSSEIKERLIKLLGLIRELRDEEQYKTLLIEGIEFDVEEGANMLEFDIMIIIQPE